ncbi:potassium channel subfamily K member 13 [Silurus meridionalis]|uniref:potassium channel subfamily K member 13 n=1 Tax=Silurus meridionalis TaxID=175797 RepID=UPI001EEC7A98|nr:potassium channel subfamily K member 13 [Silurus meridionalis]XP_046718370.1 potassium channel subfamily K member 13 [Silurus meridionalis]
MIVCIPQSTSDSSPCCCRWPWVNIDFARIVLLGLLLVLYMFFGAAVFSALERPLELEAYKIWDEKLAEFAQEHSVSPEDLHDLLKDYEEANNAGVWMQGQRMFWDFRGALCFVATVISTIGYGLAAPTTTNGRIFLIFFGLIGCSAAILLFNLFIERVITLITYVLSRCHEQKMSNKSQGAAASNLTTQPGGTTSGQEDWKPSVYHVTLIMLAVCFLVACTASGLYSAVEDWSYLESMYFCFVTFSTMGFGDMVSGQEMPEEASCFYQVVNVLAIFLGVGCAYTLFDLIAIMIKAMLNWILGKVLCLCCCSKTSLKKTQPVQICCSWFICSKVEESCPQLSNTASCFSQCWSSHMVKISTEKCRCSGSALQTVCRSEMHITENNCICKHKVSKDNVVENKLHVTSGCPFCQNNSLPEVMGGIAMLNNYLQETSYISI